MSTTTSPRPATIEDSGSRIATAGQWILRYGLVVVVAWIGALKFTHYEAAGIQPLVAHSPFLGWLYGQWPCVRSVVGVGASGVGCGG
jgi:uncharacterized membrane protein YkgB